MPSLPVPAATLAAWLAETLCPAVDDFEPGVDRMRLSGFGLDEFAGLASTADEDGLIIPSGPKRSLILRGIDAVDRLAEGDFLVA